MYKTVINPKFKFIFDSDLAKMAQVVVAALAFTLNSVPLAIIFFSLYIAALFVLSDDVTPTILPFCLISVSLMGQYGSKPADYFAYIPLVVLIVIAAILHLIFYPPVFVRGKMLLPSLAVAAALLLGGAFSIKAEEYFAPVTLYYTLTLGIGVFVACLVIYSYTRPQGSLAASVSSQMNYFTLAAVIMLTARIVPYLARGEYSWYFSWKNTLTTFLLLSSPFAFYVAAKEDFGIKAWAHFALGLAGYGAAILSFSRGGMLFGSIAVLVCVTVCLVYCEKRNRKVFAAFTAIAAIGALSFAFGSGLVQTILSKIKVSSSEARVKLWKEAVANFLKNPVFGAGVGYRGVNFSPQTGNMYWYHSTPFQIIGTAGLVGVAAYAYFYAVRFRILFSAKRLYFVFFAIAFLGYEAYQMVDASDFVPIPFAMLLAHLFIAAEAYRCRAADERDELPLKEKRIEIS